MRLTPSFRAASVTLKRSGSRQSWATERPGWGGFFMGMAWFSFGNNPLGTTAPVSRRSILHPSPACSAHGRGDGCPCAARTRQYEVSGRNRPSGGDAARLGQRTRPRRRALALPKKRGRGPRGSGARPTRRVERRALPFDPWVVTGQARLVQAIEQRNPLDPSPAPPRQPHLTGGAVDEIPAYVDPTPCEGYQTPGNARQLLVGAVAVADDDRMSAGRGEQLLRDLCAA